MEILLLLFMLVVFAAILILPIKIVASYVGAGKTGYLSCIIAIILIGVVEISMENSIPLISEMNGLFQFILSLFVSAFVYMFVLKTTYKKGMVIAGITLTLMTALMLIGGLLIPDAWLEENVASIESIVIIQYA